MNPQLQVFQYESLQLRIQQDDNGEPLIHANDLCALLQYSNPHDAVARHVDKDDLVKREVIDSLGRTQQANFLREPGMWALIMRSDAPNAKPVQRWVFAEVLPSIRKTGGYIAPNSELAKELAVAQELISTQRQLIAAKDDQIAYIKSQAQVALKGQEGRVKWLEMEQLLYAAGDKARAEDRQRHREELERALRSKHPMTELEEEEIYQLHRKGHDLPYLEGHFHRSRNLIKRAIRNQGGVL